MANRAAAAIRRHYSNVVTFSATGERKKALDAGIWQPGAMPDHALFRWRLRSRHLIHRPHRLVLRRLQRHADSQKVLAGST